MVRTFKTHEIRKQTELTGDFWTFSPLSGEHAGEEYQVVTPCCWENHPDFGMYRGEGAYVKKFTAGGNLRFEFKGVSHTATCFLDGEKIAEHYNAYTVFSAVVTNVPYGEHELKIIADNRFSEASALHIPNDYMSYGGVSRPVVVEEVGDCFIEYAHVNTISEGNNWKVPVEVIIKSTGSVDGGNYSAIAGSKVRVSLAGKSAEEFIRMDSFGENGEAVVRLDFIFNKNEIREWTPETPELYEVRAEILANCQQTPSTVVESEQDSPVVDDLIDRIGFREIKIQGKDILLNGNKIKIKGFCRHEDHPQFGCAIPYDVMAKDLELIRNLGANSIRTSHYPNDELFLDMCDEQGILVWEENHARGLSLENMQNPNFEPQAEQCIREMIALHYNHPSIYIWGILNECASETEYGRECYKAQFELIDSLDRSRPKSFASCKFFNDKCLDLPDIVSYNVYPLWYHNTPADEYVKSIYDWVQNETGGAGKPFIISEIGAGAIFGLHNNFNGKWTEEYQAYALEHQLKACLEAEGVSGVYIWQFCDCRVSEEWFEKRPRCMNNKGVVDEFRRKKQAYNVVKSIFGSAISL